VSGTDPYQSAYLRLVDILNAHVRIFRILLDVGVDPDRALERMDRVAEQIARVEQTRVRSRRLVGPPATLSGDGAEALDPDDCPCDGCGLRPLKYRRLR